MLGLVVVLVRADVGALGIEHLQLTQGHADLAAARRGRIGVVLHAGQFGFRNGVGVQCVLAHTGALAGATQRW